MKNKLISLGKFVIAVATTYLLASIFHSQFVLSALTKIDIQISTSDRLSMTLSDLLGMAPGYGSVLFIALALGFVTINAISRWIYPLPAMRYPLAGFLAVATALLVMQPLLNVTLIAGAREPLGFLFQCLAGLVGGLVFVRLTKMEA